MPTEEESPGDSWARWLRAQLDHHPTIKTNSELMRAAGTKDNGRPRIDLPTVGHWLKGRRPSYELAVATAEAFGAQAFEALHAAGYRAEAEAAAEQYKRDHGLTPELEVEIDEQVALWNRRGMPPTVWDRVTESATRDQLMQIVADGYNETLNFMQLCRSLGADGSALEQLRVAATRLWIDAIVSHELLGVATDVTPSASNDLPQSKTGNGDVDGEGPQPVRDDRNQPVVVGPDAAGGDPLDEAIAAAEAAAREASQLGNDDVQTGAETRKAAGH